ncbi:hypothetical protein EVAR_81743_1 [Eumeta japonica]|uniref:Uncharacterized protein n=1 Tax=Eumeta variegata TaxID=151549 RepID=A0A4C1UIR2_EUMVA|nr:hypothetical protein EVAR_81743_1 [Eumeta japonica]
MNARCGTFSLTASKSIVVISRRRPQRIVRWSELPSVFLCNKKCGIMAPPSGLVPYARGSIGRARRCARPPVTASRRQLSRPGLVFNFPKVADNSSFPPQKIIYFQCDSRDNSLLNFHDACGIRPPVTEDGGRSSPCTYASVSIPALARRVFVVFTCRLRLLNLLGDLSFNRNLAFSVKGGVARATVQGSCDCTSCATCRHAWPPTPPRGVGSVVIPTAT